MLNQILDFSRTHWMNCGALHEFEKNPDAPSCVVILVMGVAINSERRLAGHAGISRKSLFNCGF
ncbi:MAG: hypothetical protein KZQ91_09470 [Candidatus Thiodiazotropha sp. (ex Lucinoma borealis)]|nr:hypothetical protein [Candidatus Thiodiazotropha sp. (ex Lucinoma borealis)]